MTSGDLNTSRHDEPAFAEVAGTETRILVAVSGSGSGEPVVTLGARMAIAMGASWHAVFVETPRSARDPAVARRAAEALSLAAQQGATVSNEPAADVASGLTAHLVAMPAQHLVVGTPAPTLRHRWFRRSTLAAVLAQFPNLNVHIAPAEKAPRVKAMPPAPIKADLRHHFIALGLVAVTLAFAEVASLVLGGRPLNLLFLFPVIAAAVRYGLTPALTAAVASVLGFDFFLLQPHFELNLTAPVNLVLFAALVAVAIYTSLMTETLRSRVALSDRSANENAQIATFSQTLARAASWDETARAVCDEFASALNAEVAEYRQQDGQLVQVYATSGVSSWGPIDQAALDWCWENGEAAGSGTTSISSADWRVEPLRTSLGVLAVLAFARSDGRDPIRADRSLLYATLVSQSALAHERLVLQDRPSQNGKIVDDLR